MPNLRDKNLSVSKALPAAAATNYSDSIDLIDSAPGIKLRDAQIEVAIPATPALVEDKTVILTLEDSADNSSFAAVDSLNPITVTGAAAAAGGAAVTRLYKAPESIRRYIRIKQVVLTGGGSNIAVSSTLGVVF